MRLRLLVVFAFTLIGFHLRRSAAEKPSSDPSRSGSAAYKAHLVNALTDPSARAAFATGRTEGFSVMGRELDTRKGMIRSKNGEYGAQIANNQNFVMEYLARARQILIQNRKSSIDIYLTARG